jgi:NCS1 family nucleobase:cation symporter-1
MAEETITPRGYQENPDLLPVPRSKQGYNIYTFSFMMFSMNTGIGTFFLGPIGAGLGLNVTQALWGAFWGNIFACIAMWANGMVGIKYGISSPVQYRESFGFIGSHVAVIMRAFPGLIWFGVQAFSGSMAILMIIFFAFGVPADQVTPMAMKYLIIALIPYLGSFVLVMRFGLTGIGKMADYAGPIMLIYFIWLVFFLWGKPEFAQNIPNLYVSKVGYMSLPFLTYLAVQTNWWATMAVNFSDLTRGISPKNSKALPLGLLIGIIFGQLLGTWLGFANATLTGVVLPQEIVVKYAPGAIAVLVGLVFCFLAPWSTDLTANSIPLINFLVATLKMSWKRAALVAAIIVFFVAPWWAGMEKGTAFVNYVSGWAASYGILVGPYAGIMIANYYIIRRRNYNLQKLYTRGPGGCWYSNGWSKAGFASLIITWILCYIIAWPTGQMQYVSGVPFPGGVIWYPSIVISIILYWIFAKVFKE